MVPASMTVESVPALGTSIDLGHLHKTFEKTFCGELRASGYSAFANAKGCSVSFLTAPGQDIESLPIAEIPSSEAQLIFLGNLRDFSEEDMYLIDQKVKAAFNDAFMGTGLSLQDIRSVFSFGIARGAEMVLAEIVLPTADDGEDVSDDELALMHDAFEKAFCHQLANSGSANFANVHGCSFRFAHKPTAADTGMAVE